MKAPLLLRLPLFLLLLVPGSARADAPDPRPPTSRLTYLRAPAAESCPDGSALRAAVASRVGYDPFFPWARRTVVAEIDRRDGRFVARVRIVDDDGGTVRGERDVASDAATCAPVFDAVALDISMAIDAWRMSAAADAGDSPTPSAPPIAPPTVAAPLAPAAPGPPSSPSTDIGRAAPPANGPGLHGDFLAGAGARSTLGTAPVVALAAELFAEARVGIASLALGLYGQPATGGAVPPPGASASVSLVGGELVPCLRLGRAQWAGLCGAVTLGWLGASSSGIAWARGASTYFLAAGPRFQADWELAPRVVFRAYAEALADARPPELLVDGKTVWTAPVVSGSLGVAVALRF